MPDTKTYSFQPRFSPPGDMAIGSWAWVDYLFNWGTRMDIPVYPSPARDLYLSELWRQEPVLSGAMAVVTDKMSGADWFIKGGKVNANRYATMLHNADTNGWAQFIALGYQDFLCTNRGTMIELGRKTKTADRGPVLGLQHLDSTRVAYTGNLKTPWVYLPEVDNPVEIKANQVIQIMSMPSGRERQRGSGFCAVERLRDTIGMMTGWLAHDRQMVGDLPPEAALIFEGMTLKQVQESYKSYIMRREAKMKGMGENEAKYPGFWMLGSNDPNNPVNVKTVPLKSTGSYNRTEVYDWWIKLIALELQQSVGQFWLIQHIGVTKAVEGIHYEMEKAKGPGRFARELEWQLNWRVLPANVRFEFDAQDDMQDQMHAEILGKQIDNLTKLAKLVAEDEDFGAAADIKEMAVEWGILPPEVGAETAPTVVGARLKQLAQQDAWIVRRDGSQNKVTPVLTNQVAEKFKEVAQVLEVAFAPFVQHKHRPGGADHDQSRHGRRMNVVQLAPAKEESGMLQKGDTVYRVHASYGNINGAKGYIRRNQEKHAQAGEQLEYFRHDGKYYVGVNVTDPIAPPITPTAPPPKPKPKPPKPSGPPQGDIPESLRINPDKSHWTYNKLTDHGDNPTVQQRAVVETLQELPYDHQRAIKEVGVWNTARLGKEFAGEEYPWYVSSDKYVVGQTHYSQKAIQVAAKTASFSFEGYDDVRDTTAHEAGHILLGGRSQVGRNVGLPQKSIRANQQLGSMYRSKISKGGKYAGTGFIRRYARTDKDEYAACTYSAYVTNNRALKAIDPQGWAIMNEYFDGQEYDS
jgi:hypothetical protein